MSASNQNYTDISKDCAVYALLPRAVLPYAKLMRLDRPVGTWLLVLPCWWGVALAGGFHPFLAFLFGIGAVIMRGAGCVINDLMDQDIDKKVERTRQRPLASGEIGFAQAILFLAGLLVAGLGVLVCFPDPVIRLGLGVMPLVALYPLAKRFLCVPQLVLGFVFNWGILLGWLAVRGSIDWPATALYGAGIFWTLAYDTMYAHQDKIDDAAIGIKSMALLLGTASRRWISAFFAISLCLIALALFETASGPWGYAALVLAAAHAVWQMAGWQPDVQANCLARFQSNRDFGLIVLAALVLRSF